MAVATTVRRSIDSRQSVSLPRRARDMSSRSRPGGPCTRSAPQIRPKSFVGRRRPLQRSAGYGPHWRGCSRDCARAHRCKEVVLLLVGLLQFPCPRAQFVLQPPVVGHVVYGTGYENPRVGRQGAERDVDGEFAAVLPQADQVEARPIGRGCMSSEYTWRCATREPRKRFGISTSRGRPSNSTRV